MKNILFICLLLGFASSYAQKEFWGLINKGGTVAINYGTIFKTDFNGANPEAVYTFDSLNGMKPYGRLFQASNGKLYGTASEGGIVQPATMDTGGVLFEYDLATDRFRVVSYFGSNEFHYKTPQSGVIEPTAGMLYGTLSFGGIYKYNSTDESTSLSGLVTNINGSIQNPMKGELVKASNGFIYGTTQNYSTCPGLAPFLGCIVRLNPVNNAFTYIHPFECDYAYGAGPTGSLVEGAPGKLYGTTAVGGLNVGDQGVAPLGSGVLFEYDIATNTYTKKFDFDYNTTGSYPGPLTIGNNNKLYGVLGSNGNDPMDPDPNNVVNGSLYEYDITTNTVTVLQYFSDISPNNFAFSTPHGALLKATDGNFYGIDALGVFKFDATANNLTRPVGSTVDYFYPNESGDLIEICRKPSYRYFDTAAFTACKTTSFTFDVHNTNAVSYIWKKGETILPEQTTGILNLSNLALTDTGSYTCEMTNECGVTVTMPLQLTVEPCLGLDEAIGSKNAISLYPNPANDIINLQLPEIQNFEVKHFIIRNMLGQIVYTDVKKYQNINISAFSTGIYQVELNTDKGDWFAKFVKK